MAKMTEDEVRNMPGGILGFTIVTPDGKLVNVENKEYISGVGQDTTFIELGKRLKCIDFKGDGGMCTLFDKIAKDGELKGEAKGIVETGYEFGISESDILKRLQQKLEIPLQVAQEYLKMFGKQTV